MPESHRFLPELNGRTRKALLCGWAMYVISFGLPLVKDMWGIDGFWVYFENGLDISLDHESLNALAVNISNLLMILSPLLLFMGFKSRVLGAMLFLGFLNNSRFIWNLDPDDIMKTAVALFPAYYVWWLSFLVSALALWRSPAPKA
ncbi:MAG: hypothetical protein OSB42_10765 [Planctomycetota bacterium]|nr:hypothetical protein [Planctomycetota bacterium]